MMDVADTLVAPPSPSGPAERLGEAITWLTTGNVTDPNGEQWLVVAAPGEDFIEGDGGRFYLVEVDTLTGLPEPMSSAELYLPPNPSLSVHGARRFGGAVLAADLIECFEDPAHPGVWHACGEELLVSASPVNAAVHPGQVYLYMRDGAPGANATLRHIGTLERPGPGPGAWGGPVNGDGFGITMAAPRRLIDPARPWIRAGDHPEWVAILDREGSGSQVIMYDVHPDRWTMSPPDPLPHYNQHGLLRTTTPWTAMAAGDWNGDGKSDLALHFVDSRRPENEAGVVEIWFGSNTSATWHPPGSAPVWSWNWLYRSIDGHSWWGGFIEPYEFGSTLATGFAHHEEGSADPLRETLFIGAPGWGPSTATGPAPSHPGAVCELRWTTGLKMVPETDAGGADPWPILCVANPESTDGDTDDGDGDRFGAAIAVGNFLAADVWQDTTMVSRMHDVAVGAPGWSGGDGRVLLFGTDPDIGLEPEVWTELPGSPGVGAGFGSTLAAGAGQRKQAHRRATIGTGLFSEWADIAIGTPAAVGGAGQVDVTEALTIAGCDEAHGFWGQRDASGHLQADLMTCTRDGGTWMMVKFLREVEVRISSDDGVCSAEDTDTDSTDSAVLEDGIPAGTLLEVPWAWSCGVDVRDGSESVNAEQLLALLDQRDNPDADPTAPQTVAGTTMGVWITFNENSVSTTDDDTIELELSLDGFDNNRFGIDEDCDFDPIATFERVDLPCED